MLSVKDQAQAKNVMKNWYLVSNNVHNIFNIFIFLVIILHTPGKTFMSSDNEICWYHVMLSFSFFISNLYRI